MLKTYTGSCHCGVRPFGMGTETPIGTMYGVNIGCLENVSDDELSRIPITYVDGRRLTDRPDSRLPGIREQD